MQADSHNRPVSDPMLSPDEALATILRHAPPLTGEVVELSSALGRGLRRSVRAGRALPPGKTRAMDGYGVRPGEIAPGQPLRVRGPGAAGPPATAPLPPGSVRRIMTGAPIPAGADA